MLLHGSTQLPLQANLPSTGWSFWVGTLANVVKVAEAVTLTFGVFQLWAGRAERKAAEALAAAMARKDANYQAWQVINSAQGKGGSGGRIDALHELALEGVSLAGVCLDSAWLVGVRLSGAHLPYATMKEANLAGAELCGANLERADLRGANLVGADLRQALLKGVNLVGTNLGTADLRGADLGDVVGWEALGSVSYANVDGIRNAPAGFRDWAVARGAIDRGVAEPSLPEQAFSSLWRAV